MDAIIRVERIAIQAETSILYRGPWKTAGMIWADREERGRYSRDLLQSKLRRGNKYAVSTAYNFEAEEAGKFYGVLERRPGTTWAWGGGSHRTQISAHWEFGTGGFWWE